MTVRLNEDQSLMLLDEGSWDQAAVIEHLTLELSLSDITVVVVLLLSDGTVAGYLDVQKGALL